MDQNTNAMWSQLITQVAASCKRNPAVIAKAKELDLVMRSGGMTHRRAGHELMKVFVEDEVEALKKECCIEDGKARGEEANESELFWCVCCKTGVSCV